MAQLTHSSTGTTVGTEIRILGLIGTGHFMSHFYNLTLPLLITFLAADFGYNPAQLGIFIAAFAIAAALAQLPVGLLVDKIGARAILFSGLTLEAVSIGAMAFADSYTMLIALAVTAGLGHSVFHPADYAIMNSSIDESRIGRAFSMHTVTGTAGSALAPVTITFLAALWDWRLALIAVAGFGMITAVVVASQAHILKDQVAGKKKPEKALKRRPVRSAKANLRLLITPSVLVLFAFFLVTTMVTSGIQAFGIFTLVELHSVAKTTASTALTAFLIASAFGVIVGGWLADKTPRHGLVATISFMATAVALVVIGEINMPVFALLAVFASIGILQGLVRPARDMMVRTAMPPGTAGTIFAFMSTGRLIGSAITPVIVGLMITNDMTDKVFMLLAICSIVGLATLFVPRKPVGVS
ncbi:MAG: MFS transporter [Alphaproteobacteria bacterium]|nr:MFS transporter [Alphaproteobacteria bacterium]